MGNYSKLEVWNLAQSLCVLVYKLTESFPTAERYGLTQQLRRAAVSVSSNIAEGAGRAKPRELAAFLRIARGSLHEVQSQLDLAVRLGLATAESTGAVTAHADRVGRMLNGMMRSVAAQ